MPGTPYARLRALRRVLISDVDGTLLEGGRASRGCAAIGERLADAQAGLVLATGRDLKLTLEATDELMAAGMPRPEALICSVGSEIYLGEGNRPDASWAKHISEGWDRDGVQAALAAVAGLTLQDDGALKEFKVSYFFTEEPAALPDSEGCRDTSPGQSKVAESRAAQITADASRALLVAGLPARLIPSAGSFLDVLPQRASKGAAVSWLISLAALDPRGVIVAGDSGNDREMMLVEHAGRPIRAVIVGNHEAELADLVGRPHVYVAEKAACAGVLEGIMAHGW